MLLVIWREHLISLLLPPETTLGASFYFISFQSGYNTVPKAQCLFFSYCWCELASEGKIESGCSPISPLHDLPSESTVAVQSCAAISVATESTMCSDTSAFTVLGVPCWESTATAKSWGACPNALQGRCASAPWAGWSALEGYWLFFWWKRRNARHGTGTFNFWLCQYLPQW